MDRLFQSSTRISVIGDKNMGTGIQSRTPAGRPCALDQKILDDFANKLNRAGVPYHLFGPNSNSAASGGLNALGLNGWTPPIILPGWGTPLTIPK